MKKDKTVIHDTEKFFVCGVVIEPLPTKANILFKLSFLTRYEGMTESYFVALGKHHSFSREDMTAKKESGNVVIFDKESPYIDGQVTWVNAQGEVFLGDKNDPFSHKLTLIGKIPMSKKK